MALTNTITANVFQPYKSDKTDKTPIYMDYLQTAGSKATSGSIPIFSSATSSDDFFLSTLNFINTAPTAASLCKVYLAKTQIAELATASTEFVGMNFGTPGALCGTTTTATVSIVTSGGTSTVYFHATGFRKR